MSFVDPVMTFIRPVMSLHDVRRPSLQGFQGEAWTGWAPFPSKLLAFLHRQEGDAENAAYWYRLAGKPIASGKLDDEWAVIARALL